MTSFSYQTEIREGGRRALGQSSQPGGVEEKGAERGG